jgi:fused signal recognition particle receptor
LDKSKKEGIKDPRKINEALIDMMFVDYVESGSSIVNEIQFAKDGPTVLLVEGVNGVGKTTTHRQTGLSLPKAGQESLLVAGDTFRAGRGGTAQSLGFDRLHCPIVTGKKTAIRLQRSLRWGQIRQRARHRPLIVDTAGRLQTKSNLMAELAKMKRVLSREIPECPARDLPYHRCDDGPKWRRTSQAPSRKFPPSRAS